MAIKERKKIRIDRKGTDSTGINKKKDEDTLSGERERRERGSETCSVLGRDRMRERVKREDNDRERKT